MKTFLILVLLCGSALAHDHSNPAQDAWYQELKQPDNPTMPCCGESDAYWADEVHVRNGKTYVTITDDRDDGPLKRPHIPNGTEIEVPNNKLKWDRGQPHRTWRHLLESAPIQFCILLRSARRGLISPYFVGEPRQYEYPEHRSNKKSGHK